MAKEKKYIINDETVTNSHGFVLINSGGDFERFKANPVMLVDHNDDAEYLIGTWDNLRTEGNLLIADPKFDEEDARASSIKGKVERDVLKGLSPGIYIQEVSTMVTPNGGTLLAVTKWELLEISFVTIPSNAGSLRLYAKDGTVIPEDRVKLSIDQLITHKNQKSKMDKIVLSVAALAALGVNQDADVETVSAKIVALQRERDSFKLQAETAQSSLDEQTNSQAIALVDLAVKEGKILATQKDQFVNLAKADFKLAQETLSAIPAKQNFRERIVKDGKSSLSAERENWTYLKWLKDDPQGLETLKKEDPETVEEIKKRR